MRKRLYIWLVALFLSFPDFGFSTHIVGGSLTYVYNGGSNYTITLKLYRDCSPTSAAFPGSVTINVAGYNGAAFSPNKDITINLGTVTPVTPTLDPCAIPPNPMPCVQEGLYTITVNNLPPNPGGYHLSYQIIARNLSLTNVNAGCNCVGETYYAYIPGPTAYWAEDFTLTNGTTVDNGATAWSTNSGGVPPSSAGVTNNGFELTGANDAEQTWTSQIINIAPYATGVNLRVDLSENGTFDPNDSIMVYYRLDGGPLTLFSINGSRVDDFGTAVANHYGLTGNTVQIVIKVHYDANSPNTQRYRFDNVIVSLNDFKQNNNPVFKLFPPLFLCVDQPFTFDHSALDTDGDSLYYSFYTPYNGDNGTGPLDPTFPGNVATFTPIVFKPGYSYTNPLGGAPLSLDPNTGLLSGTPTQLGQFVVGILVKEYRNGVFLSQTLRDFQFNILNCPAPPPTVGGTDVTINDGCTKTLNATGFNPATTTWTSIFPGTTGSYNNYLSCTSGCLNPTVTASGSPPPYVDYVICGMSVSCRPVAVCDTVRVTFNPSLVVSIAPQNPSICFGQSSTTLTATGGGGTPPYSYLWNSVYTTQSVNAGVGTYTVRLSDASGCPPAYASVIVTSFSVAISADAGADQTVCSQGSPVVILNGSITGASGGIWSGGAGSFNPNTTTLSNVIYTPTAAEINAGSISLYLTTTGNGTCPADQDTITVSFSDFLGNVSTTISGVSCFGGNNGSATVSVSGGSSPFSYSWATVPVQTTASAGNLALGTYSVTIQDGIGCTRQTSVSITQPTPLSVNASIINVSCQGGSNGRITATPAGGTSPYTYSWMPGGQTTAAISNKTAGTYTLTVTDSKGCQKTAAYTITQPPAITILLTKNDVSCNNGSDGSIASSVTGGTAPYRYSWNPGGATAPDISGLSSRTYTVTVRDNKNCIARSSITINQPAPVSVNVSKTDETCDYLNNGSAAAIASGGIGPYTYLWLPSNQTTSSVSNLTSGTYTLTVMDSKNCPKIVFTTIAEPMPLSASFVSQTNVNCFSENNGSVTVNVSGGTLNYSYSWQPGGQSTSTINSLSAGSYTVNVVDNNGCQTSNTVTITQPVMALNVGSAITHVSCNGGNNGSVSITANGGVGPYSYSWQPGNNTTSMISGLSKGVYTVTVTDSKGCEVISSFGVSEPSPIDITFIPSHVSCFNGSNGSISSSVSGGTSPYAYKWSPGNSTASNLSGLPNGTYTLTVTDNKGCTLKNSVTITEPSKVIASATKTNETCRYLDDGTATASASGGTPGYTYSWQPMGETTTSISGLTSGNYVLTATDSKGCTGSITVTIGQPSPLSITFTGKVNVSCFGGKNGRVTAKVSGGTPNYSYLWLPGGATTATALNLSAGTYTVTVTDNNNCQAQDFITINEPAPVSASSAFLPPFCYGGKDGSASITASGGTPSYTYRWMPGKYTGQNVSGLSARTYTITVTDLKKCVNNFTLTITQPAPVVLATSSLNASCGMATGTASVTANGGNSLYTYQWSPAGGTDAVAPNLSSGTYAVLVTDATGCTSTAKVNVNDNSGPSASIFSVTHVTCNGGNDGTATGNVVNGTPPFTYLWSPYGGTDITAAGLSAGAYIFTVIDSNGCQSLATTAPEIMEPPPMELELSTLDVNCFGDNTGTAIATASGGTPGFTYEWLPAGTTSSSINGLAAGTYTLNVRDANTCLQTEIFTITQPDSPLTVNTSFIPVSCNTGMNGSVSASASGGTSPYDYSWSPGSFNGDTIYSLDANTYSVTVTDIAGCSLTSAVTVTEPSPIALNISSIGSTCSFANGQASVTATGGTGAYSYNWLPSGDTNATATGLFSESYTVTVSDANGCSATTSITVNDNPSPITVISSSTNVSCNAGSNGTATVSISGGTGPFSYSWLPAGGTNATATGLTAGTYTVIVTDDNGCLSSPVSCVITEPSAISINIARGHVSCFGEYNGSCSATATGGIPGYAYQWLPLGTTGTNVNGLSAGSYTLQVTDANNCVTSNAFAITQPVALSSFISSSTHVKCFDVNDGSATVSISGGTQVYNYSWSPVGGNGPVATNLSAGTYSVNISDFHGCTTSASVTITQPLQALSVTAIGGSTSCFGGSDGIATANPAGGTPGYSYQWNPSGGSNQTANGLSAGNYFILVTDTNGCPAITSVTIAEPNALSATLVTINPSCGLMNGAITSQVGGGTGPYTFSWQPGSYTTDSIKGLAPGTYTLQITDTLNCKLIVSTAITDMPGPVLNTISTTNVSCYSGNDGAATISISQGTPPFTINWLPYGGNSLSASSLIAGTYTVNVTDSMNCTADITITITEPLPVNVTTSTVVNVSCNGSNDGSVTISATGGTGTYTYNWTPTAANSPTITNLTAGTYFVTVADQNNCSASIPVIINQPETLTSSIVSVSHPICFSGSTGSAFVSASGGSIPYNYLWSTIPAQTGSTANNLIAGSYMVTVTDNKGCTSGNNVTITQPSQVITTAGMNDTICLGQSGSVSATASGGAGNYTYVWQPPGLSNMGTLIINPTIHTTYTVIAYDQNGCPGTTDSVSAIVYNLLPAHVQLVGLSPICPGQSFPLYVQTSGTTGPLTYTWNNGLSGSSAHMVTPPQPTTYIVTVSNSCGTSVTDSVQILFNPPPTLIISSDSMVICAPGAVQFYDKSITGNVNDQIHHWFWTFGDGTTSTLKDPSHIYTQPGTYVVNLTVTTGNGCTSNNTSAPYFVNAYPFPIASFNVSPDYLNIPYDKLICTNESTGANTYLWSFGDGGSSIEIHPQYLYKSVGTYRIRLIATSALGCSDTAYRDITTNADLVFPNAFTPNPNGPNGGYYNMEDLSNDIFFPYSAGVTDFKLEIYNRWGELIFETFDIKQGWDGYYRGQLCQKDVYIWKAYAKLNNGKTFNLSGDVTLLR